MLIHRTKTDKASHLYETQLGKLLSPPSKESIKELDIQQEHAFKIKEPYTDIVISGLGWITIPSGNATVIIHSPKDIYVTLRRSFIAH